MGLRAAWQAVRPQLRTVIFVWLLFPYHTYTAHLRRHILYTQDLYMIVFDEQ